MKRINYVKMIEGSFRQLLKYPEGFAARIGIRLISGFYQKVQTRFCVAEALAVWAGMDPSSAFYREVGNRARRKHGFSWEQYFAARDAHVKELCSQMFVLGADSSNEYVHIVCMFMSLPSEVARKWLWHENVDFQSCESFLRRLTSRQYESLKTHSNLIKNGVPTKKLPCFTEGVLNKVWGLFNITFKGIDRMAAKSALAHDFLGMGMGFSLYPDAVKDEKADRNMASQFLSKQNRGAFEVNKEHGGLYWFLYRKLRSNALYHEDEEVELGRWICPGFWFTMFAWGILAIASPASLIAAVGLLAVKGVTSLALFGLGSILPSVAALVWVRKIGSNVYDKDYWKWVFIVYACLMAAYLAHMFIMYAKGLYVFGFGILCAAFLLPYCIKEETIRFWQAPILGKVLPLILLGAGAFDLYLHTGFFENCLLVLQAIGNFFFSILTYLFEMRFRIMEWALAVICYFAMIAGLFYFSDQTAKKSCAMIDQGDHGVYRYERIVNWVISVILVAVVAVCINIGRKLNISVHAMYALTFIMAVPFVILRFVNMIFRSAVRQTNDKVVHTALSDISLPDEDYKALEVAIASNPFWASIVHVDKRAHKLRRILHCVHRYGAGSFDWALAFIRAVKNDQELANAVKFVWMNKGVMFYHDVTEVVLRLALDGVDEDVILQAARDEDARRRKVQREKGPCMWARLGAVVSKALSGFVRFLYHLTWPLRALWRGACDLYRLWEVFNEQCPQAPSNDRSTAQ